MKALFAFLLVFLIPSAASASIVGSPHDIAAQGYTISGRGEDKKNVCNFCHVPHKAKGARLWASSPPSLKGWGKVGPLCYSCHDGVAIVSPYVDASNTVFNPKSHGLVKTNLPAGDEISEAELPYTNGGPEETSIECSTCHNPHDDTIRPFLRVNLTEICVRCHKGRQNTGYGVNNVEGTHPVHKALVDDTGGPSPIDVSSDFKVPFPDSYPSQGGKYAQGVHWKLGGHLDEGEKGMMECITCHSIHGRDKIGPAYRLLSVDPVKKNADLFCEGCHKGIRGDELAMPPYPNPGGSTGPRTYHPADDDTCNGPDRKLEITEPPGWVFGKAGEVLCTTCHKVHGGMPNSPMLRPNVNERTFCEECHTSFPGHHPSFNMNSKGGAGGIKIGSGKPRASTRPTRAGRAPAASPRRAPSISPATSPSGSCARSITRPTTTST